MSAKVSPHLLDTWQRYVPLKPGIEKHVRSIAPVARRFVFDSDSSAHLGRLLFEAGDLVCEQIAFAKPPYEHTYVEIADARRMFDAWRPGNDDGKIPGDDRIGLLYTGNRMYTLCSNNVIKDLPTMLGMFYVDLGKGQTTPLAEIFGEGRDNEGMFDRKLGIRLRSSNSHSWQEYVKLSYLLGGMRQPDGTVAMVRADYNYFANNYDLGCAYGFDYNPRTMYEAAFQGGGDLLIGAAAMLLIHGRPHNVTINPVMHQRKIYKGKMVVYKAHGIVNIKLTGKQTIRKVVFGNRASPRLHDVMGTWAHYHRDRQCDHDWERLEDPEHERYMCRKCPTLRTWRKSHYRGDATKGIKTKTYEVHE